MKKSMCLMGIAVCGLLAAPALAGISVTPGISPLVTDSYGELRFRNFGRPPAQSQEVYIGEQGMGSAAVRSQGDIVWQAGTYDFTFSFDGFQTISTTLSGPGGTLAPTPLTYDVGAAPTALLNYLQIEVRERNSSDSVGSKLSITDLELDGNLVGTGTFEAQDAQNFWHATGLNLNSGFTLAGKLTLDGPYNGSFEATRVTFKVGNVIPEPAAALLGLMGLGMANALRRRIA